MRQILRTIATLFLFHAATVLAQYPTDIRISPPEPDSHSLPNGYQFQSAASIGGTTLAVWSTADTDAGGLMVPVLRMQLLRDGMPVGPQQTLNDAGEEPYAGVKVIPASRAFLVLWDDLSPTLSTHMRRVGLDGSLLGPASKLDDRLILIQDTYVMGDPARFQTIVWNRFDDSCVVLTIDSNASPYSAPLTIGKQLSRIYTYGQLPGLYLLRMASNERGVVRYQDGRIDSRTVPLGLLTNSFNLSADSSLVILAHSDVSRYTGARIIYFYHSMFDAAPFRTSTLPMLDTLSSAASSASQIIAVNRRPSGDYDIYVAVVMVSPYDPALPIQTQQGKRQFTIYRVTDSTNGNSSAPEQIFDATKVTDMTNRIVFTSASGTILDGNSNTHLISFNFPTIAYAQTDSARTRTTTFEFSLDSSGIFKFDRSYGTPFETASNGPTGYIPAGLPIDSSTTIARVANDTASVVRVTVGGNNVLLSAASRASQPSGITITVPQICAVQGDLLVSWIRSKSSNPAVGMARYQAVDLTRWEGMGVTAIDRADTLPLGPPLLDPSRSEQITSSYMAIDFQPAVVGGPSTFLLNQERHDNVTYDSNLWNDSYENVQRYGVVGIATPAGWHQVLSTVTRGVTPNEQQPWVEGVSWDPNSHELTVASGILPGSSRTLSAFDEMGEPLWSLPCVTNRGTILPLTPSEYLLINEDSAFTYRGVERLSSLGIPFVNGSTTFYRLLGPWFIRITHTDELNQYIIERFDLQAHRIDSAMLSFQGATAFSFLQNGNDSTLILLYLKNGIRMMRLTRDLHVLFQDSLVSITRGNVAQPAGTMRNDTLFVVWQDMRNSEPAIYGNWLRLERMPSVAGVGSPEAPSGAAAPALVRLYPNPARDAVRIEYRSSKECDLEIIDRLGRVLRRVTAPANPEGSMDLSTSALESGIYLVRLRSADATSVARLVVVR